MYERWGKRAFDIAVASLLLLALSPVFALVALAVRWRLGAPIFFVQQRAGRFGRPFAIKKFRSMREGAGSDAERLDRFGRALRASGLDELPQLLNVLSGEMSLVGPRPLPLDYLRHYSPRQALLLRARPGIAGPGVAAGRHEVAWPERLELAAAYGAAPPSLARDLALIGGTLGVWLRFRGAEPAPDATGPPFKAENDRIG